MRGCSQSTGLVSPSKELLNARREFVPERAQFAHARLAHFVGDLPRHARGPGLRPLRVGEGVNSREPDLAGEGERRFEVRVGLPGEPGDDVGGDSDSRDHRANAACGVDELGGRIAAAHALEDGFAARLEREVEVRHEARIVPEREQIRA